ncbi:type II restriction enzyme [Latilactobacillus curvatus]|uniref:type II restriction enzyme n=1 Tax=Latilactobacillus curvatus TaxID=28038 RepID=UPI0007EBCA22|nr:hypothetical protein [Latilactobacillus curvatus]ANJ68664.1 hypothetical protein FBA2_00900 [Latilactobacillus curvatus]MCP8859865.1 hypothetical protein [Latilactobacillus curvatus]
MTKANDAWTQLFDKYNILEQIDADGVFNISATQIKEFYEPRLITKYDWSSSLPDLFKKNKLVILPSSRGTYTIGRFKAYQKLNYENIRPIVKTLPSWVSTWDSFGITSEAVALNVAKASGMIDHILMSDQNFPAIDTITGRLKSGDLNYKIEQKNGSLYDFHVANAQVEIDAGFESLDKLAIVEAKTHIPEDFIIRQLYHPYRVYNALGTQKPVIPLYFTYADEIYTFYQYEFTNVNNYSSIKKVRQYSFILNQTLSLNLDVVKQISVQSPMHPESTEIVYPQANTFQTVLDMMQYLATPIDKNDLAEKFNFDVRQSDYYANSLRFLGLAQKEHRKYVLTDLGQSINSLPNSDFRNEKIIRQILSHITFKLVFDSYLKNNGESDDAYIDSVLAEYVPNISGKTIPRRRSTVKQWISWIFSVIY